MSVPVLSTTHRSAALSGAAVVAALGVVFGDIGTSPLYALKAAIDPLGTHPLDWQVKGVLSLIAWALTLIVSVKYVAFVLRADNEGEGGILALMSLLRRCGWVLVSGVLGYAFLVGDGIITPAISVLSAIEGLKVVAPSLEPAVLPLSVAILVFLFAIQSRGTHSIGRVFGPVMLVWFLTIGALGAVSVFAHPEVLAALNPVWAVRFVLAEKGIAFTVFGAVFLAVTGGEAMYADLGHCGRGPIRAAWFVAVFPALLLNYFGQGALIMADPSALSSPFFALAPEVARLPLVILATAATVIASQALISGVFSMTRQAIQLGFVPRLKIKQTYASEFGQIYLPGANWTLMVGCCLLVVGFKSSDAMAAAYGIAVSLTMLLTTVLVCVAMRELWKWNIGVIALFGIFFIGIDGIFATSNLMKVAEGGWVPLTIGGVIFFLMTAWARGANAVRERLSEMTLPLEAIAEVVHDDAVAAMGAGAVARVPGTMAFLTKTTDGLPPVVCQYIRKTRSVPEHVVIVNFQTARAPHLHRAGNIGVEDLGHGFWRVTARYGFMQMPSVAATLKEAGLLGLPVPTENATIVLGSEVVTRRKDGARMGALQSALYGLMQRNAARASLYFRLPKERTLEFVLHLEV